jgi:hypothetical protein
MPTKFDHFREKSHTSGQIIVFRTLPDLAGGPAKKTAAPGSWSIVFLPKFSAI